MDVKVTRYGGFGGRPPKQRSFSDAELDLQTRAALEKLRKAPPAETATRPDAYAYVFEIADEGAASEVTLSGPEVPEPLRRLLP